MTDLERAVVLAASPPPRRRHGKVILVAAALVAVVALGTAYVVGQGSPRLGTLPHEGNRPTPPSGQPPLPPLQTDAGNQAAAVSLADRTAARLPTYPGAHEVSGTDIPELRVLNVGWTPDGFTKTRSRFWTVQGNAQQVAQWYAAHPQPGFVSDGGPDGVGGSSRPNGWNYEVFYDAKPATGDDRAGVSSLVQTTQLRDGTVGVRGTVKAVWSPARPVASFVQDVRSIDVRSTHDHYGRQEHVTRRTFTVTNPGQVLRAAKAFDALPGQAPFVHSCPMIRDVWTDRIVFHTATGDVTAIKSSSLCGFGMQVRRDGRRVQPDLGDARALLDVLGLDH